MKRRGGKGQALPSLMHMLQKVEGEVKAGSLTISKIENPAIEKANGSQEKDLSQERVLSAIIVTSLGICKKIAESIKEIKRVEMKTRMKRMVQLQLYLMVMLPLFVMIVVLILHVRIPPGLQIQQLLTILHPDVIFTHPTLLVTLVKLGWEIKVWPMLWALEIFGWKPILGASCYSKMLGICLICAYI